MTPKTTSIDTVYLEVLEKIKHHCPIGVLTVDRDGNILTANETAQEYFEYSEKELQSLNFQALTPRKQDLEADLELLESCLNSSAGYSMTKMYLTKTFKTFWAYLKVVPIRVEGEFQFFLSFIVKDIGSKLEKTSINEQQKCYTSMISKLDKLLELENPAKEKESEDKPLWQQILVHNFTKIGSGIVIVIGALFQVYHEWKTINEKWNRQEQYTIQIQEQLQSQNLVQAEIMRQIKELSKR